jgi:hypothetical protein
MSMPWWQLEAPAGVDRGRFLRGYVFDCLARQKLDGDLALFLAKGANEVRCLPPLPASEVTAIAESVARRVVRFRKVAA